MGTKNMAMETVLIRFHSLYLHPQTPTNRLRWLCSARSGVLPDFSFHATQGEIGCVRFCRSWLENPLHIVLIAVPLIIQTFLIFAIAYSACRIWKLPYKIAAPAGMIGASNFFELAVAVAIALFGASSPAALATTVGVLTEVPVMLCLVRIANKTQGWFPAGK